MAQQKFKFCFFFLCVNNSVNSHIGNDDVTTGEKILSSFRPKRYRARSDPPNNYFLLRIQISPGKEISMPVIVALLCNIQGYWLRIISPLPPKERSSVMTISSSSWRPYLAPLASHRDYNQVIHFLFCRNFYFIAFESECDEGPTFDGYCHSFPHRRK